MSYKDETLDVVLIHHPTSDTIRPIYFPAMGLLSLADTLDRADVRVQLWHLGVERTLDPGFDVAAEVAQCGAKIAAISVHWFFQLPDSLALVRALKQHRPDLVVVLGGFTASFFARDLIEGSPEVDVVVKGDGELPLRMVTKRILDDRWAPLGDVPNLVYRSRDGQVEETPFDHTANESDLAGYNFSRLPLLRHHREYLSRAIIPTKHFAHRFSPPGSWVFPLEVGRGCPYQCTFCGGGKAAQKIISNRHDAVFRPVSSVMQSLREVVELGCHDIYVCFDPDPERTYYRELFRQIRQEGLSLRLMFGAWALPSRSLIEEVADTFLDGLFEISPETASESLRDRNKGRLSYSNAALEECISTIEQKGLVCQLFFGYFLPGDTVQTVMETQRYARSRQGNASESLYLAFSTDPGSLLQLNPQEHGIHLDAGSLDDYLRELSRPRSSSNLLAHRPEGMSQAEARQIETALGLDTLLRKFLPQSTQALGLLLGDTARADEAIERVCLRAASDTVLKAQDVPALFQQALDRIPEAGLEWLSDLAGFEATPYIMMEKGLGKSSTHYSVQCTLREASEAELSDFADRHDAIVADHTYRYDTIAAHQSVSRGEVPDPTPQPLCVRIGVDEACQALYRITPNPA